jgi:hypothetical protein
LVYHLWNWETSTNYPLIFVEGNFWFPSWENLKYQGCNYLTKRIWKKLVRLNREVHFFFFGRGFLIVLVTKAIPTYVISFFLLPKGICEQLEIRIPYFCSCASLKKKLRIIFSCNGTGHSNLVRIPLSINFKSCIELSFKDWLSDMIEKLWWG